jgi:DNA-directed RNA polymerase subunit N (RpoN/RPB10)
MKLTKKLEAEILETYNKVVDANLSGDIKTFASILDDNCHIFGTAASEVFKNKKAAVKFYAATAGQVTGKVEFRNRKISVMAIDNEVMVNEKFDFYLLIDDQWAFYGPCRVSCLFHKKNSQWKVIHMHGSFPDSKTEEGEQINSDKIKAENIQLRDAIKRRTIELENKNRELEIESSLEKVRAVAMGMRKPDDMLEMCSIISQELTSLGVKEIRNIQTAIIDEEKTSYLNYEYFRLKKKTFITAVEYKKHKDINAFVKKMLKDPEGFFTKNFKSAELKDWVKYQAKSGQYVDPHLFKVKSLHYYFYSIGPGALGISAYAPLSKEAISLFKRFRNVFQLAYRRFIDIQKAEAQAREAQIEASLEKVRAQALGMRKSEDLPNVCQVLFKELKRLGFSELRNAMVNIHNDEKRTFVNYDYSDEIGKSITPLFYDIHPVIKKQVKQIRSADDAFSETVFKGADLKKWKEFRKSRGEKEDKRIKNSTALYYYFYSIGTGSIGISTFNAISEEKQELLKRFRNVFAFAYRRYMDVAMAEAQAKEAKIELGLERVRARAMAMQNSNELAELVSVVFKELTQLDFALTSCIIWISDTQTLANTLWVTSAEMNKPAEPVRLKAFQHSFFHSILHAWKEKDPKWIYTLTGKEKTSFEKVFFANEPRMPLALKKALSVPKKVVFSASFNNFGALEILGTEPLTEEKFEILHRFGKVFDSSYTRFNDLKKAEAQAREAQIELGLERVRARAMAMKKSDELSELVNTVFKELTKLDFALNWCIINIIDESSLSNTVWAANPDINKAPESYHMLFEDYPFHHAMMKGWKERNTKCVYVLEGHEKKAYDEYLFNETEFRRVPEAAQAASRAMEKYVVTFSFSNFGGLQTVGDVPLSDANLDILSRFGKVFDLTYTRFNDLKQAEAQAKESQIEAALEKVRSRSMGMQKSEELKEVINIVYQQLIHLKINLDHAGFVVDYMPEGDWHFWIADEQDIPSKITHPYFESVWANQFNEAKEKGADFFATHLNFEEKNKFYNKLLSYVPGLPETSKNFYLNCPGLAATTVLFDNVSLYIENFSGTPYTDEENKTLIRFGKVFQQTYTRFLDLQKAEAQAREAKIEAALERTRTQSMIMQHSKELDDTLRVFHEQVLLLGIHSAFSFLWLPDEKNDRHIFWAAWK